MRRPWLAPLVPLYAAGVAWREFRREHGGVPVRRLQSPVISIGNLSTGGSGKTPLTIALAKLLVARGLGVDVLSRGYGRRSSAPARVDPSGTAEQFGDEPLLIAREAGVPVYVAPQRYDAGLLAETNPRTPAQHEVPGDSTSRVHILDDGFQHRQLHRTVDILLLNREDWEDSLLPAGNLREALHAAHRAGILAVPADDTGFEAELHRWGWSGPIWRLHRGMEVPDVSGPVFAFCGIARPEQFFEGLKRKGLAPAACKAFRDHHRYTREDLDHLIARARTAKAAAFITTDKDAVRLGPLASSFPDDLPLLTAKLRTEVESAGTAVDWLLAYLAAAESALRL